MGTIQICRYLQDTSNRKLADFFIFLATPPPCFPGLTRRLIKTGAPVKKIGMTATFSRVDPEKKGSKRRVNRKIADSTRNRRVFCSR